MRKFQLSPSWMVAATVLLICAGCSSTEHTKGPDPSVGARTAPQPAGQLPEWKANAQVIPTLKQKIDSTKEAPRFTMDMPPDFHPNIDVHGVRKLYLFRGPVRRDKTLPVFMVTSFPNAVGKNKVEVDSAVGTVLKSIKMGRSERWANSRMEHGTIDGQPFVRCYWQGQEPVTKKLVQGFVYGTQIGDAFLTMSGQDFEQYVQSTMTTMESACQTFKVQKESSASATSATTSVQSAPPADSKSPPRP